MRGALGRNRAFYHHGFIEKNFVLIANLLLELALTACAGTEAFPTPGGDALWSISESRIVPPSGQPVPQLLSLRVCRPR